MGVRVGGRKGNVDAGLGFFFGLVRGGSGMGVEEWGGTGLGVEGRVVVVNESWVVRGLWVGLRVWWVSWGRGEGGSFGRVGVVMCVCGGGVGGVGLRLRVRVGGKTGCGGWRGRVWLGEGLFEGWCGR